MADDEALVDSEQTAELLSKEQVAELDDDEFYAAYKAGKIPRRTDHWTEDNFEEEMEKHPFFMTKEPSPEEFATNPHLAALQEMFAELTPVERVEHHKSHGNEAYKKAQEYKSKNKKMFETHLKEAIHCYTEGLKEICGDEKIEALLLSNRAMCQILLRNNRSALTDCKLCIRYSPSNVKAHYRAALACHNMTRFTECIEWCDLALVLDTCNSEVSALRQKAVKDKAAKDKAERAAAVKARRKQREQDRVSEAINERGIRIAPASAIKSSGSNSGIDSIHDYYDDDDWSDSADNQKHGNNRRLPNDVYSLLPSQTSGAKLEEGTLHWPVLLVYPEHAQTDFIQEFEETCLFQDHLEVMFPDVPEQTVPWDSNNTYKWPRLSVYFEQVLETGERTHNLVPVSVSSRLCDVLQDRRYCVFGQVPTFTVIEKSSQFSREFLQKYTILDSTP
eukprot:gene5463-7165_t